MLDLLRIWAGWLYYAVLLLCVRMSLVTCVTFRMHCVSIYLKRFLFSASLSLAWNPGCLTQVRRWSCKSSTTTHSCQCVRYFNLSRPWYGCPCLGFSTCAQMLMCAIAHGGGLRGHRKRVCSGSWYWEKNPLPHRGLEPLSVLHHGFSVWCSTNWAIPPPPTPTSWTAQCMYTRLRSRFTNTLVVVSLKYTLLLWGYILEAVVAKGSCGCVCVCLDLFRMRSLNLRAACALVGWYSRDLTCVQCTLMWRAVPEVSTFLIGSLVKCPPPTSRPLFSSF